MEARKTAQRTPSRKVVIAMVVLLVAVAVVGIVVGREQKVQSGSSSPAKAASAAAATAVAAEPTSAANEVVFAPASAVIPGSGMKSIAQFAATARSQTGNVRIISRFLTGADRPRDFALASARTDAVLQELQKQGLGVERIRFELIEVPQGALSPRDVNRIELALK